MRSFTAFWALFLPSTLFAQDVQYGPTYLTCYISPERVGLAYQIRSDPNAICDIRVERLTKKPLLLGVGTYKKEWHELASGAAEDVFELVADGKTAVASFEAEKCSSEISQTVSNGDTTLAQAAMVPDSELMAMFCSVQAEY